MPLHAYPGVSRLPSLRVRQTSGRAERWLPASHILRRPAQIHNSLSRGSPAHAPSRRSAAIEAADIREFTPRHQTPSRVPAPFGCQPGRVDRVAPASNYDEQLLSSARAWRARSMALRTRTSTMPDVCMTAAETVSSVSESPPITTRSQAIAPKVPGQRSTARSSPN